MSLWSSLDELGSKLANSAGKVIDQVVDAKLGLTNPPPVAVVPNATVAQDTSAANKPDPNATQKYVLWGVLGVAGLLVLVGAVAFLKRK